MEQYSIYEGHMDDLMSKVNRIRKKCTKLGCSFTFNQVGEEFREIKDLDGNMVTCKFILVEAEGTAVVNNWEFVSSVEHTPAGNLFSKAMTEVEIPAKYRTTECICEHCNSHRMRKETFIIRNTETDEFKQVGKSCLKEFTNGLSVETATFFASLKDVFQEAEELPAGSFGSCIRYANTKEVLQFTAEIIRHFGFVKTADSEGNWNPDSTKNKMDLFFDVYHGFKRGIPDDLFKETKNLMQNVGFNPESEEASKMVSDALTWLNGQEASNDYMHNLKVACGNEFCHCGRYGILVSLFPTFNRELEYQAMLEEQRKKALKERQSDFVGQVGDKVSFTIESVDCITSWSNCFDGYHTSITYVWKIVSTEGNVFTWKTSNILEEEQVGMTLTGTVKDHKTFREVKQTELTRCRIKTK